MSSSPGPVVCADTYIEVDTGRWIQVDARQALSAGACRWMQTGGGLLMMCVCVLIQPKLHAPGHETFSRQGDADMAGAVQNAVHMRHEVPARAARTARL